MPTEHTGLCALQTTRVVPSQRNRLLSADIVLVSLPHPQHRLFRLSSAIERVSCLFSFLMLQVLPSLLLLIWTNKIHLCVPPQSPTFSRRFARAEIHREVLSWIPQYITAYPCRGYPGWDTAVTIQNGFVYSAVQALSTNPQFYMLVRTDKSETYRNGYNCIAVSTSQLHGVNLRHITLQHSKVRNSLFPLAPFQLNCTATSSASIWDSILRALSPLLLPPSVARCLSCNVFKIQSALLFNHITSKS